MIVFVIIVLILIAAASVVLGLRAYQASPPLRQVLSPKDREFYESSWRHVESSFPDHPVLTLETAEHMTDRLVAAHGYPKGDPDGLPARYSELATGYREALAVARQARENPNSVSTEALQKALVEFHALSDALLGDSASVASRYIPTWIRRPVHANGTHEDSRQ